ncbi:MAG: hypothetical protein PHU25_08275 [Deltaproteobacteria bacterium]|nr:hypothetical protein [Deltaproteobacteria bacterium]
MVTLADLHAAEDADLDDLTTAVEALEKAAKLLGREPSSVSPYEVHWRLGRACLFASEIENASAEKTAWLLRGEDAAEAATRENPNGTEGYYYLAALRGRRAQQGGLGGITLVRSVEKLGLKAAALDPKFEDAGAYRLLGMLYSQAPPWPTSVGDMDLAVEYAQKAVDTSDYPLNKLFLAQVLIEAGNPHEARTALRDVLAAPKVGRWARVGERWRPYARQLQNRLEEKK